MSHLAEPAAASDRRGPRISVLGAAVVETDLGSAPVVGRDAHPLLALLAISFPRPVSVRDVIREAETATGRTLSPATFRTRVSRLGKALAGTGVAVERAELEGSYRLSTEPSWVDALEFARLAEAAIASRSPEAARTALAIWSGEIPVGADRAPVLARLLDLRHRLEAIERAKPRRVLVVEDLAGPAIKRRLLERYAGALEVVIHSDPAKVIAYLARDDTPNFDLVLLDFHLTEGDEAFQGYEVAAAIRDGDAVTPVLGMSYHRSVVHNDKVTSLIYDLWDVVPKRSAAGGESLDAIATRALRLLDLGTADVLRHYRDRVPQLIECAEDELHSQGNDPARLAALRAEAESLRAVAERGDLAALRAAERDFARHRLPRA